MVKRLIILASILVFIGIIGSVFTFKGKMTHVETIEKYVNMEDIQQIEVILSNGAVEIVPTDSEEAKIEFKGDTSIYDFSEKVDNQTLYIFAKERGIRFFTVDFFSFGQTLRIEVPKKHYDSIKVNTDNGRINVENLQVKMIETETDNGRVKFENITSEGIIANTSNGRISLVNSEGEINAHTENGKIDVALKSIDQSMDLSTSNGAIHITTEIKPENMTIDAYTDNGSIRIFGKKDWDIVTGTGEHLVKLSTNNGSIKMEEK